MPPIRRQPVAELYVTDALSVTAFVPQGVAGALADCLALPLADGAIMVMTKRPAADPVSSASATEMSATVRS
jgi:hypothetical protein